MTAQLALLNIPTDPDTLTARQRAVHDALHNAGPDGIDTDHAGAITHQLKTRWAHSEHERCINCARDGKTVLHELARKGLARYRRKRGRTPGTWVHTSHPDRTPEPDRTLPRGMTDEIPY